MDVLFLSGYHMARDEFIVQTKDKINAVIPENSEELQHNIQKKTIFIKRETPELFIEAVKTIPNIKERVILIKNFDLFDVSIYDAVKENHNLILSGNLDHCAYKISALDNNWKIKIFFSQPDVNIVNNLPKLEKYQGYVLSDYKKGIVSLRL